QRRQERIDRRRDMIVVPLQANVGGEDFQNRPLQRPPSQRLVFKWVCVQKFDSCSSDVPMLTYLPTLRKPLFDFFRQLVLLTSQPQRKHFLHPPDLLSLCLSEQPEQIPQVDLHYFLQVIHASRSFFATGKDAVFLKIGAKRVHIG